MEKIEQLPGEMFRLLWVMLIDNVEVLEQFKELNRDLKFPVISLMAKLEAEFIPILNKYKGDIDKYLNGIKPLLEQQKGN